MIHTVDGNLSLYSFESFEEYLDRATAPQYKKKLIKRHPNDYVYYSSGWGTSVHTDAMHNARHGWTDCLEDIAKWSDMVVADISSQIPKPDLAFDKTGSFWDLGRVIEQDPDCWIHEEPSIEIDRPGKGNIIRMVINTASSAAVRTNSHRNRCGAILALCQLLEKCGFYIQFEITTAIEFNHSSTKLEFRTIAKRASEALNLPVVSYWCSSDMENKIDFAICETMDECYRKGKISYGGAVYTQDGGDICFDRMHSVQDGVDWNSEQSVRQYIKMQLMKQGVVLK